MFMEFLKAFLIGGVICAVGQVLIDYTKLTPARILVSFVVAGVVLGALGWYQPLVDFAGAGASVPLTGFGNLLAKGVREAIGEGRIIGRSHRRIDSHSGRYHRSYDIRLDRSFDLPPQRQGRLMKKGPASRRGFFM